MLHDVVLWVQDVIISVLLGVVELLALIVAWCALSMWWPRACGTGRNTRDGNMWLLLTREGYSTRPSRAGNTEDRY